MATVKELIEILSTLDPDAIVVVPRWDNDIQDLVTYKSDCIGEIDVAEELADDPLWEFTLDGHTLEEGKLVTLY